MTVDVNQPYFSGWLKNSAFDWFKVSFLAPSFKANSWNACQSCELCVLSTWLNAFNHFGDTFAVWSERVPIKNG